MLNLQTSQLHGQLENIQPPAESRGRTRRGLPLQLPTDSKAWLRAVQAVMDAGYAPRRPNPTHLKVGPYNYYPSTMRITRDPRVSFKRRGIVNFLALLEHSTSPLPRLQPDAAAVPTAVHRPSALRPPASLAADYSTVASAEPAKENSSCSYCENPFATVTAQQIKVVQALAGPFDLCLSTLRSPYAEAIAALAAYQYIDCEIRGLEPFIRSGDVIHLLSDDLEDEFPF